MRFVRVYFVVVGVIGLITGAALLAAPAATDAFFTWPISPPLTAIFMGAGYLGTGITLILGLVVPRSWREARLILPPIAGFACLMLLATVLHADRFFWERPITWAWTIIYGVVAVGAVLLLGWSPNPWSPDPADGAGLAPLERAGLALAGVLTGAWVVILFVEPTVGQLLWPWPLSPLTARIVAGWVAVAAVLALCGSLSGDARALHFPLLGWLVTVILFIVCSGLNLGSFSTGSAQTITYFAGLGSSLVGAAWLLARVQPRIRHSRGAEAPPPHRNVYPDWG